MPQAIEPQSQIEGLLHRAASGDERASEELLPLVYSELRGLARRRMASERPGHTLQPTALVHEAYLRLVGAGGSWENREHFFGAAAEAMRRILIERARRYTRLKHGGEYRRVDLEDLARLRAADRAGAEDLLMVDQVLARLEAHDADLAKLFKLRTFAGFSMEETAQAMGYSERTAHRRWSTARAWIKKELANADETGD